MKGKNGGAAMKVLTSSKTYWKVKLIDSAIIIAILNIMDHDILHIQNGGY